MPSRNRHFLSHPKWKTGLERKPPSRPENNPAAEADKIQQDDNRRDATDHHDDHPDNPAERIGDGNGSDDIVR